MGFQKHLLFILIGVSFTVVGADDIGIAERYKSQYGDYTQWNINYFQREEFNYFDISEFGIQKTGCFGRCPAYSLIFKIDGSVQYHGGDYVDRKGIHKGHINPRHFRRVLQLINESEFALFKNNYAYSITDGSTTYTMVVQNKQEMIVRNYMDAAPATLWAIEQSIDDLQDHVIWIDPDANPKVSLKCTHGLTLTESSVLGEWVNQEETSNLMYYYEARQFGSRKGQHDWTWGKKDNDTGKPQFHINIYPSGIGGTYWDSERGLRNLFCSKLD